MYTIYIVYIQYKKKSISIIIYFTFILQNLNNLEFLCECLQKFFLREFLAYLSHYNLSNIYLILYIEYFTNCKLVINNIIVYILNQ